MAAPLPIPPQHQQSQALLQQHGGLPAVPQASGRPSNVFPDEGKVRELALQIHSCLVQAQQLKMASAQQQQQQQQPQPATNQQVRAHLCMYWNFFLTVDVEDRSS